MRFPRIVPLLVCVAVSTFPLLAQSPDGNINGLVSDPSSAAVVGAEIVAVNDVTGVQYTAKTNNDGIYVLPNLPPGPYRLQVSKIGFKTIIKPDIVLNVQDALSINFTLPIGAFHEIVTVEGGAPLINTESAAVSTVVDRQFAENLPMNGRSFQTLIYLTPGVVVTASNTADNGQFSVNGQRASSNYWMVDGVSANVGIGVSAASTPGNGIAGAIGSFSAMGGTNSLVSVDAMQEFRIQTSTYAPEFGRTPGGQISILTRSGTNQFHGTVFDYLRNDLLDANNWFNGYTNVPPLPKPKERQNDFGGTIGGPILKDRTFFFFSYEGLRLRLPQTSLTTVPDSNPADPYSRQYAIATIAPFLNGYPLPNGPEVLDANGDHTGMAQFNASYSNPATLDAYSLRVDHKLGDKIAFFGRYNYSPSEFVDRGGSSELSALSVVQPVHITVQTATFGVNWAGSSQIVNDLRVNYSRTNADSYYFMDSFGGAMPLVALPFPEGDTTQNSLFSMQIFSWSTGSTLNLGKSMDNTQRQTNLVDSLSLQRGSHSLKFGADFRRLTPSNTPPSYKQVVSFATVPVAETGVASGSVLAVNPVQFLFRNLGVFAQDTWRIQPRLTLTYGLRWDLDFVPSTLSGPQIPAIRGYDLDNLSQLSIAPIGTPPFKTTYGNVAPRLGLSYQLSQTPASQTVLRGGLGVFYDLLSSETGTVLGSLPPFGNFTFNSGQPFPWTPKQSAPPAISPAGSLANLASFNPNLKLPYTLEWNVALEQALGREQTISASYVGAAGKRLLQTTVAFFPPSNPNIQVADFIDNTATSGYNALQVQFQRRLSQGFQALASYAWSHSIDDGSAGSSSVSSNLGVPGKSIGNRGNSDFDVRHALSAGITYEAPVPRNALLNVLLHGWSLQNFVLARSAIPVDLSDPNFFAFDTGTITNIRPDLVPGQPFYLSGSQYPGGKALNPAAFTNPPIDPTTGNPLRQGDLGRNVLRAFGATQWDFSVHREFPIHDRLKLQFRAEMFNAVNHPNFGPPNAQLGASTFGLSTESLAQSLSNGSLGAGGFNPLYQIGGPRSIQFALKAIF